MAENSEEIENKFLGAMLGSALGDAIGELAFRYPEAGLLKAAIDKVELLRYTDDTAMALGLTESLVKQGDLDPEHLGRTFHRNFQTEPWRGYATGPPTIFHLVEHAGLSYEAAARQLFAGEGSLGNGAAMRVAPLGLFCLGSPYLYDKAAASAVVTHAHPLAQDGAAIQALAVAQAVQLDPREPFPGSRFLDNLISLARTDTMQRQLHLARSLLARQTPCTEAAPILGRSVKIHESLPFALYAFLSRPHSYTDCLWGAVLNGGDRDTLGAMAGAVSGAYLGVGALPESWREKLENRDLIERLARALLTSGSRLWQQN